MAAGTKANVNPAVLAQLRVSSGFSKEEVAKRLNKDPGFIDSVEAGESEITIGQVRKLADAYKRPLSEFFLKSPPVEEPLPHDFRRLPGEVAGTYSRQLIAELRKARERREAALDLIVELGDEFPKIQGNVTVQDDPEAVGRKIRTLLGVEFKDQRQWGDGAPAYRAWRSRLSSAGILVFQFDTISDEEVLGFSLSDRPLPIIGVNLKQTENRRTFTILHEAVHVLIGESSVCDIDDLQPRDPRDMKVEVFCNAAAAAALMPKPEFLAHPIISGRMGRSILWTDEEIAQAARDFGCSRIALVRRMLTLGKTKQDFYENKHAQYLGEYRAAKAKQREKNADKEFRRSWAERAIYNLDRAYIGAVLRGYHAQQLTLLDASKLLDVRPERVREVEAKYVRAAA